ncbi:energy transducer TonB [Haloferula sp. A504]|uniref:energy transducer TonB n=1 Tax=Haloferula sp. A504 TaxID=3373601 RepID=UPI0031C51F11|nr:energy transducer TonB [Verrucomicrobiaceae bacterium E54]
MKFTTTVLGLAMAAALLALLGLTRLVMPQVPTTDLELREVEIAALPEPPPPPPEDPPPEQPPPPPALANITEVPDPTRVAIPKVDVPLDLEMPVDTFFTDIEPAPLPQPVVRRVAPKPRPTARPSRPSPPPAVTKSIYSINELDSKPRLLRHGSAAFPSSLARRGVTQGTVNFEVELSTSGRVNVRRVVSATHSELVSPARRIAGSARFTAPTRNGKPVKAVMRWPITIRK